MQYYNSANKLKWQIGKQNDVAIADGQSATNATKFISLSKFDIQKEPEIINITDAEGNRSTNSHNILGIDQYPFSLEFFLEVDKLSYFLKYCGGEIAVIQDGATGAYTITMTMRNNVVLPYFTMFYAIDGEHGDGEVGYKRATGCHISKLSISIKENESKVSVEGFALQEDSTLNIDSTLSSLTISSVAYQSATGLIRYTFSGSPSLANVKNGDVLDTSASALVNATNKGQYVIVTVSDAGDYVDVDNTERSNATDDETGTFTGGRIDIIETPVYTEPTGFLISKHMSVKDAVDLSGLSSATINGLREFNVEVNNNSEYLFENPKSAYALAILAKNIEISSSLTQIISTTSGKKAKAYKEGTGVSRAWEFDVEDQSKYIGTSVSIHPRMQIQIPEALGFAKRTNMATDDNLRYEWELNASEEQAFRIILNSGVDPSSF
jgi:hypothetical protein